MAVGEAIHERVVWVRDETGRKRAVTIESSDPREADRIVALCRKLERKSEREAKRWSRRHATFTDVGIRDTTEGVSGAKVMGGYPWEGPRFDFALLLGESPTWAGPGSLEVWGERSGWTCRFCGHYGEDVPIVAYCLGCDRSGRDRAIPVGKERTEAKKAPEKGGLKGGKG